MSVLSIFIRSWCTPSFELDKWRTCGIWTMHARLLNKLACFLRQILSIWPVSRTGYVWFQWPLLPGLCQDFIILHPWIIWQQVHDFNYSPPPPPPHPHPHTHTQPPSLYWLDDQCRGSHHVLKGHWDFHNWAHLEGVAAYWRSQEENRPGNVLDRQTDRQTSKPMRDQATHWNWTLAAWPVYKCICAS